MGLIRYILASETERWRWSLNTAALIVVLALVSLSFAGIGIPSVALAVPLAVVWGNIFAQIWPIKHFYGEEPVSKKELLIGLLDTFCTDCGKVYVTSTKHVGYDSKTGEKKYEHVRGCPDADSSRTFPSDYPNCGRKPSTVAKPGVHTHDPLKVETSCGACIDTMVTDGVITKVQADKLYADIGARVPDRDFLSSYYPITARSMSPMTIASMTLAAQSKAYDAMVQRMKDDKKDDDADDDDA